MLLSIAYHRHVNLNLAVTDYLENDSLMANVILSVISINRFMVRLQSTKLSSVDKFSKLYTAL